MKSNFLKYLFIVTIGSGLLSSCINDDRYDVIDTPCYTATANKTVADIYAVATAATPPAKYTANDVIEAYVTSSDEGGTFYKSISFQSLDGTKAFSIPVDMYNIYTEFEPGRKVYINLKNRYFNLTFNSLIIGDLYQEASVGRLVPEEFRRTVKASCESISEELLVKPMTITEALNDNNINKLIELSDVQFSDEALNTTYYNPNNTIGGATNIYLVDKNGKKIIFRTSEFAKFANKDVPSGRGKVRGVLTKYNSDYQFLARTERDIQLTGPRLVPLFEETFTSNFPIWTKYSAVGAQVWTLDTQFGNPGSCAKMSGFSSGNLANEDWLISPAQNLASTTTAFLSFDNAYKFAGNPIQVYLSNNYSGTGNPNVAGVTWTEITGAILSSGNYVWTNSGALNISSFTGAGNTSVYIAFKYTSTTSAASTWEIDNVKIVKD